MYEFASNSNKRYQFFFYPILYVDLKVTGLWLYSLTSPANFIDEPATLKGHLSKNNNKKGIDTPCGRWIA